MITIITSTLNSLLLLEHTADSIFRQGFKDWQWIIVDGDSSDGTKEWLEDIAGMRRNVKFISEPDQGIYDAWNKALPLVRGAWVIFLGAGDKLKSQDVLQKCVRYLEKISPEINLAYGSVEYIKDIEDSSGTLSPPCGTALMVNGPGAVRLFRIIREFFTALDFSLVITDSIPVSGSRVIQR